jgi:hypothetical protein
MRGVRRGTKQYAVTLSEAKGTMLEMAPFAALRVTRARYAVVLFGPRTPASISDR